MTRLDDDAQFLERAIELAHEAEREGNLPIGSVLVLDGEIIGEGHNRMVVPRYDPGRHAEVEALRSVAAPSWERAWDMTCYSTLEPCVMCTGTLLLHGVGRVVFGAADDGGGGGGLLAHLPSFFERRAGVPEWIGPILPERCDALSTRARAKFVELPCGQRRTHRSKS